MNESRSSRQSFLGESAAEAIARCRVGVVGLGGGGSHVVQQLAHVGFRRYILFDPDVVKDHNLNRLVGATAADAENERPKLEVAERLIRGLNPDPEIEPHDCRWQEEPVGLQACDLIFGCVDGLQERVELEACARRYLIPYIDIGLTVGVVDDEPPRMSGQVVLTMPDGPCLRCLHVVTEPLLAREAAQYGDAGIRPQVVWANGVLASTAVGLAVELLTGWTRSRRAFACLQYNGNAGTVVPHPRLAYLNLPEHCPHFPPENVGPARFTRL